MQKKGKLNRPKRKRNLNEGFRYVEQMSCIVVVVPILKNLKCKPDILGVGQNGVQLTASILFPIKDVSGKLGGTGQKKATKKGEVFYIII